MQSIACYNVLSEKTNEDRWRIQTLLQNNQIIDKYEKHWRLLRAVTRITLLLGWFLVSLVQQSLGFILRTGDGRHLRLRFYRGALRILGIRIRVFGDFSPRRPLFVVANHVSYLDVFVLGSLIPAVFVSKEEVRDWPVVGWVASLQKTIFIARQRTQAGINLLHWEKL